MNPAQSQTPLTRSLRYPTSAGAVLIGDNRGRPPFKSLAPLWPPNAVSNGCIVQSLCSSLVFVLHFQNADIEFDFVLMTSAYSQ